MSILSPYFSPIGPGAAFARLSPGKCPTVECIGLAQLETKAVLTPKTRFDLASCSKVFTAVAIMLLVERGQVELDAPIDLYLPAFSSSYANRPVRIQDLLWHTSGITDYLADGIETPPSKGSRTHIEQQLPIWMPLAEPGLRHAYSNTNYVLLASIVEAVTGISFSEYVEVNLLIPFGLKDTHVGVSRESINVVKGYRNLGYGLASFEPVTDFPLDTLGDGGIFSCLEDMMHWLTFLWDGQIVKREAWQRMITPGVLDNGKRIPYGMGLQIEQFEDGRSWVGHGGSWVHSTVIFGRYSPGDDLIIILSNEWMAPVERISQRAQELDL